MNIFKLVLVTVALLILPISSHAEMDKEKIRQDHRRLKTNIMSDIRKSEKAASLDQSYENNIVSDLDQLKIIIEKLKADDAQYQSRSSKNDAQYRKFLQGRNQQIREAKAILSRILNKYILTAKEMRSGIDDSGIYEAGLIRHIGAIENTLDYIMTDLKTYEDRQTAYALILESISPRNLPF